MYPFHIYAVAFGIAMIVTILTIPFVTQVALHFHFVDTPNERKVHTKKMPRLGGIAIILGFTAGFLFLQPDSPYIPAFLAGGIIIATAGILDDKFSLTPWVKLAAQTLAALVFVSFGPVIDFVNIPFIGYYEFGWISYPLTILWLVTVTNAINLIDGLDGLAGGVSAIALGSLLIMAVIHYQVLAVALTVILLGATLGFLIFNFHPARIFMGDSGALFIGYTIAVISVTGLFKSLTLFSLILPIIFLAVPIFDTMLAVIRRLIKRQKVFTPDKQHLHHRLLAAGFSHRATVLIICIISAVFSASAIILSKSILWGAFLIIFLMLAMLQFFVELADVLHLRRKPMIRAVKRLAAIKETPKGQK